MNCSTCLYLKVVRPMTNLESALHASGDSSFETEMNDAQDEVMISNLEMALDNEIEPWSSYGAATASKEAPVEHESRQIKNCLTTEEHVIPP